MKHTYALCMGVVFWSNFVIKFFVFLLVQRERERERELVALLLYSSCLNIHVFSYVLLSLPHGDMGWSESSDCAIS